MKLSNSFRSTRYRQNNSASKIVVANNLLGLGFILAGLRIENSVGPVLFIFESYESRISDKPEFFSVENAFVKKHYPDSAVLFIDCHGLNLPPSAGVRDCAFFLRQLAFKRRVNRIIKSFHTLASSSVEVHFANTISQKYLKKCLTRPPMMIRYDHGLGDIIDYQVRPFLSGSSRLTRLLYRFIPRIYDSIFPVPFTIYSDIHASLLYDYILNSPKFHLVTVKSLDLTATVDSFRALASSLRATLHQSELRSLGGPIILIVMDDLGYISGYSYETEKLYQFYSRTLALFFDRSGYDLVKEMNATVCLKYKTGSDRHYFDLKRLSDDIGIPIVSLSPQISRYPVEVLVSSLNIIAIFSSTLSSSLFFCNRLYPCVHCFTSNSLAMRLMASLFGKSVRKDLFCSTVFAPSVEHHENNSTILDISSQPNPESGPA